MISSPCHVHENRSAAQRIPSRRLVGVLGGMGPAATIDFMTKIVMRTPANFDQDHVPMIVHSVPQIPDRSYSIEHQSDAPFLPMLAGIRMLEANGAELIAIPCNTAHFWYDRLARSCSTEIVHIADAVTNSLGSNAVLPIALMATRGTIATGIYGRRMAAAGVPLLIPDHDIQNLIDSTIWAVKSGQMAAATRTIEEAASRLLEAGAERLLLACTELPLAMAGSSFLHIAVDASDALARACVDASLRGLAPMHDPDRVDSER